jgi:hypothetical protein
VKLKDSVFGDESFWKKINPKPNPKNPSRPGKPLNTTAHEKAAFIRQHLGELENLSVTALDFIATVLIRDSCKCELVTYVIDESNGERIEIPGKHTHGCLRIKYPVIEDLNDSTIRRRQKNEVSTDPQTLVILEESSYR